MNAPRNGLVVALTLLLVPNAAPAQRSWPDTVADRFLLTTQRLSEAAPAEYEVWMAAQRAEGLALDALMEARPELKAAYNSTLGSADLLVFAALVGAAEGLMFGRLDVEELSGVTESFRMEVAELHSQALEESPAEALNYLAAVRATSGARMSLSIAAPGRFAEWLVSSYLMRRVATGADVP